MGSRLKLNGHYDLEILKLSRAQGVRDFGFDFRPRSFNFLQNYKFVEILDEIYNPDHRYFLQFESETDNVLNMFMDDVKKVFASRNQLEKFEEQVFLEFSDLRESSFYNKIPLGFYWHMENEMAFKEVQGAENLKGIILSFQMLERLQKSGQLFRFIGELNKVTSQYKGKVEIGLNLGWSDDIFPSLFEFLNFDFINLSINSQVETSYRHIDEGKLVKQLTYFESLEI